MKSKYEQFWLDTADIITHPVFMSQKAFIHHHTISIYDHVLIVAYRAYRVAKALKLDYISTARGALLHDFFLYDWHIEGKRIPKRGLKKHGFTHAKIALKNAETHFDLNRKEKDIIVKHMFPLNLMPPRYFESWLVSTVDTWLTFREVLFRKTHKDLIHYIDQCVHNKEDSAR